MKHTDERVNQAIAVFLNKRTGKRTAIMPTITGGMYQHRLDYEGLFPWGATADITDAALSVWQDLTKKYDIVWQKTPNTNYHVWHICYCDECKGRVFTHSQGDWDSHLRDVANEKVFTFPSID